MPEKSYEIKCTYNGVHGHRKVFSLFYSDIMKKQKTPPKAGFSAEVLH